MIMKIREFEKKEKRKSVPILVLTGKCSVLYDLCLGDPSENEKFKCLSILKANAFMNKPIQLDLLKNNIRKAIVNNLSQRNGVEGENTQILIIDDDSLSGSMMIRILKNNQFKANQAITIKQVIFSPSNNEVIVGIRIF